MHLARDCAREIREQIECGAADLVQRRRALQKRVVALEVEDHARIRDAGAGQRPHRPGRDGVDADALAAEIGREITHGGFQRRLGHAHDVVRRHDPLRAAIGQRDHRTAVLHQRRGALGHFREREARDQHGIGEIFPRRVGVAALQLAPVGEGQGVNDEIEAAPGLFDLVEDVVDRGQIADVARDDDIGADRFRQRHGAAAERIALIAERQLGPMCRAGPCDAPGDRAIVGHPHDKAAFASQQRRRAKDVFLGHERSQSVGSALARCRQPCAPGAL